MQTLRDKLYLPVYASKKIPSPLTKISIIGCGKIGMATAFSLITKGIPSELVIIDLKAEEVEAEVKDLLNARQFFPRTSIYGGSMDVLSYVVWRISGFPRNRVIGLGTMLDTSKFCNAISRKIGLAPDAVSGYLLGEQGDRAVPIWSSVTCAGVKLRNVYPEIGTNDDNEGFKDIPAEIAAEEKTIENAKGSNSWATALAVCRVCQAILTDSSSIIPLSTHAKGLQGVDKDIFFSLPCIVNSNGVRGIMLQQLADDEKEKLFVSAKNMEELLNSIEW